MVNGRGQILDTGHVLFVYFFLWPLLKQYYTRKILYYVERVAGDKLWKSYNNSACFSHSESQEGLGYFFCYFLFKETIQKHLLNVWDLGEESKTCLFPWECSSLLKSVYNFRRNLIHMFLILFSKFISMLWRAHVKSMTLGVTLSYLSLKQEVTFPMRAETLALRGKRMCSKLQGARF